MSLHPSFSNVDLHEKKTFYLCIWKVTQRHVVVLVSNKNNYLFSVGNSQGCVQVFNLGTGLLTREYTIHTGAVK